MGNKIIQFSDGTDSVFPMRELFYPTPSDVSSVNNFISYIRSHFIANTPLIGRCSQSNNFLYTGSFNFIFSCSSVNYGWILCLADNASNPVKMIALNTSTVYIHTLSSTRTIETI